MGLTGAGASSELAAGFQLALWKEGKCEFEALPVDGQGPRSSSTDMQDARSLLFFLPSASESICPTVR